ncbi:MAG TPA: hypothetical protein ACFYEC_06225, partial [Candidatus Brocadiaceae bacterium]
MQTNKQAWLKGIVISCGIVFCIAAVVIFIVPIFVSGNFIQQKVTQALEDRFKSAYEAGPASFHWPNRIDIPYLTIHKQGQDTMSPIQFENIQGTVKLLPLLFKKIVVKKISIQQINYENRLSVKDFVTDKFSCKNDIIATSARLKLNSGSTTIDGTIDLRQKKIDLAIKAKDIYITQDIPAIGLLPIFASKVEEVGGIMNFSGCVRGNGLGREILNKELLADVKLEVTDGYIRGNKIVSSLLKIVGVKDTYSFHTMDAVIQIKDGKIYTQKMDICGPIMSINVSGTAELEGAISYDAVVKFNKEHLNKDIEKITSSVLRQNAVPVEIRGTIKDPKVSVKLSQDNLEHL